MRNLLLTDSTLTPGVTYSIRVLTGFPNGQTFHHGSFLAPRVSLRPGISIKFKGWEYIPESLLGAFYKNYDTCRTEFSHDVLAKLVRVYWFEHKDYPFGLFYVLRSLKPESNMVHPWLE